MTPEQQAQMLAEWLERHPGSEPPPELDPEVVEAVYALRPDLAPPPRVTADDILAEITAGPLAAPAPAPTADAEEEEEDDEEGGRGAPVVPFPGRAEAAEPATATSPRRRRTWVWGGSAAAAGTLLAMAAAALLFVRMGGAPGPDAGTFDQVAAPLAKAPQEEDLDDAVAIADLPEEPEAAREAELSSRTTLDADADRFAERAPELEPVAGWEPEPAPAPEPAPPPRVAQARPAAQADAPPPPPAAKPRPREQIAETRPPETTRQAGPQVAATETPPVDEGLLTAETAGSGGAVGGVATGSTTSEAWSEPAIADAELEDEESLAADDDRAFQRQELDMAPPVAEPAGRASTGRRATPAEEPESDEVTIAESKSRGFRLFGGGRKKESAQAPVAEPTPTYRNDNGVDLDSLRAQAVPTDLPQTVLLARVPGTANEDANAYAAAGQYAQAGDAALSNASLPQPDGATSAAQAATWYLAANQADSALQAANEGIANTAANTPETAWLWVLRGDALRTAGDQAGAAAAYQQAIDLNSMRAGPVRSMDATETSAPPRR